ncbi:hypothetical protein C8J57DRAFT_1260564 [Mycena rebaudengoi]|nr:hypothetical protein C8J57DRAFT_1260564 [Mycena rebaudengoi]
MKWAPSDPHGVKRAPFGKRERTQATCGYAQVARSGIKAYLYGKSRSRKVKATARVAKGKRALLGALKAAQSTACAGWEKHQQTAQEGCSECQQGSWAHNAKKIHHTKDKCLAEPSRERKAASNDVNGSVSSRIIEDGRKRHRAECAERQRRHHDLSFRDDTGWPRRGAVPGTARSVL